MKSSVVLAALVGFALVNTAFLGLYLTSGFGSAASSVSTIDYEVTSTAAAQSPTTATSALNNVNNLSEPSTSSLTSSSYSTGSTVFGVANPSSHASLNFNPQALAQFFETHSPFLAPTSWFFVGGMWIWRGRMKSKWTDLGFDSDVFGLFVRMKGAKTRIRLLDALSVPKDRLQLAQELGLDWKAVDRHVTILKRYGFVEDRVAYGKVRMYELTPIGRSLLHLLEDLSREDGNDVLQLAPPLEQ